jgi:hypothetical protein
MQESEGRSRSRAACTTDARRAVDRITSGTAFNSLVEQGITTLGEINDNFRFSRRIVGELLFELVRRDLAGRPMQVTVGQGIKRRVVELNKPAVDEQTGQQVVMNDVSRMRASIVLDDMPQTPTFRQQIAASLMEMTKGLPPQLQAAVLDLVIQASDLPNKDEFVERIQKALGLGDGNVDPEKVQLQQALQQCQAALTEAAHQLQDKSEERALKAREIDVRADEVGAAPRARRPPPVARREGEGGRPVAATPQAEHRRRNQGEAGGAAEATAGRDLTKRPRGAIHAQLQYPSPASAGLFVFPHPTRNVEEVE